MDYIHYAFQLEPAQPAADILAADLGERGFESFVERPDGLDAYIQENLDHPEILSDLMIYNLPNVQHAVTRIHVKQVNWNAEWEKQFDPVVVDDYCLLRAPFHAPRPDLPCEIVMQPRMAFGTGHHATTYLMIRLLMGLDLNNKRVIDMGCGTSVLAIFAKKHGASTTIAIDIDEWATQNSVEHIQVNDCATIDIRLGGAEILQGLIADVFIANINRNILLADMAAYAPCVAPGGTLLLSGFYEADVPILVKEASQHHFNLQEQQTKDGWVALRLTKAL
jgi:ribosomal protein L11 methyltransferase